MPSCFPPIPQEPQSQDRNPAIRLFGRRFFADQTVPEYLVEFLLVAASAKRIKGGKLEENALLPAADLLHSWPSGSALEYAPKARLNLKLFSFVGTSRLDTRHPSHRKHYQNLINGYKDKQHLSVSGEVDAAEVLRTLENLFLGFQGVGGQRTWCAASFLPITRELLAGESIWQKTRAAAAGVGEWDRALPFFSHTQQIFLARGGELLYLHLCNALRQDESAIRAWAKTAEVGLSPREADPSQLHGAVERALTSVLDACPETVGKLAEFLDSGIESDTAMHTDFQAGTQEPRFASCGWCPEESWPEGVLFAVELVRLCEAVIDPIERLQMLELACAMQVLRSLCAQSARYASRPVSTANGTGPLGFVWALSDPPGDQNVAKQVSRRNVNAVQRMIHDAVRHPDILAGLEDLSEEELAKVYKEADGRYGHKLFLTVAKRIGLIVPKRGAGARFVLNDKLLRFLVLAIIRPGERVTYESFKKLLFVHYGIAVDDDRIALSCEWSGTSRLTTLGGSADIWLVEMLDASGVLIRLSDSCSLVTNPFDGGKESR